MSTPMAEPEQTSGDELTIDELARQASLPVRTIREWHRHEHHCFLSQSQVQVRFRLLLPGDSPAATRKCGRDRWIAGRRQPAVREPPVPRPLAQRLLPARRQLPGQVLRALRPPEQPWAAHSLPLPPPP